MTGASFRQCPRCGFADFARAPRLGQLYAKVPDAPKCTTSADLARFLGISVQNASNRLRRLESAGLVTSRAVGLPGGGLTKEYFRR